MAITFEFGSADLTEEAQDLLDNLGAALQSPQLAEQRFRLNGHTDAVGSDEANQRLSLLRAESVRTYLATTHSIDPGRLEAFGHGEARLIQGLVPEDGQNRRVEVELVQ
jgi:outer membrane protein OmpA-like peptidoglycan-associated protein